MQHKKQRKDTLASKYTAWLSTRAGGIITSLILVLLAAVVFALRYTPAFTEPNFYAEDGTVFVQAVYDKNPVSTLLTPFNGYLVVGQYALAELAVDANAVLQLPFTALPTTIAVINCLFLGLTVTLPFIFLRKQLGLGVSLALVVLGAGMPLPGFDYAVIGTLGNLKFAFLYWAFILALFRFWNAHDFKKVLIADSLLLLSVLTYAPAVALLPVVVIPYAKEAWQSLKKKKFRYFLRPEIMSLVALALVCLAYLVVVYVHGIPKLPGYLDTPYNILATVKILFRSTFYAVMFFATPFLRDSIVLLLFAAVSFFALKHARSRWVYLFALWAIFIGTASFVLNRPGISEYLLKYGKTPDQFFYAQGLVFVFALVWLVRPYMQQLKTWAFPAAITLMAGFVMLTAFFGSSGGKNDQLYKNLGTVQQNVQRVCQDRSQPQVLLQIYPSDTWKWQLPRSTVCG